MKKILFCLLIMTIAIPVFSFHEGYVTYYGKLYRKPDQTSQLLSILDDSCRLRVLREEGDWVEVQAKGYRGWIERSSTDLKEITAATEEVEPFNPAPYFLGGALCFSLCLALILRVFRRKKPAAAAEADLPTENRTDLNILIFTAKERTLVSGRNGGKKRISTCFREIGFTVHLFESLKMGRIILNFQVSLIAVDYALHKRAVSQVEFLLKLWGVSPGTPILFYNVPPHHAVKGGYLTNTYSLGEKITDSELLNLISPIIEKAERKTPGILHGTISGGSYELLQLIELGKKSGVLTFRDQAEQRVGVIGFREGKIIYARCVNSEGKAAAAELCRLRSGFFAFTGESCHRTNCSIEVTQLLFHIAQTDDEQKNQRGQHETVQNSLCAS